MSLGRYSSEVVVYFLVEFDSLDKIIHFHALTSKSNTHQFFVVNSSLPGTEPNRSAGFQTLTLKHYCIRYKNAVAGAQLE